jgi:pimeloyl-ACP methyl ester carboxylesterase
MRRSHILIAALAAATSACTSSSTATDRPSGTVSHPAPSASAFPTVALSPCLSDQRPGNWHCGSIDVPLDRANPDAGTISILFYIHSHDDDSTPASEPVFATPGGPGSSGQDVMGFAAMDTLIAHHDIVAIDPRGTGRSGAIDCADLQDGSNSLDQLKTEAAACGAQLGDAADRYGAGDIAMDVDAVREALGYDQIDYYAFSYGTVPEQAYAVRFPEHLHALVFDAGFAVTDPAHRWFWGLGQPAGIVRAAALICQRDPGCSASDDDPDATIRWLVKQVGDRAVEGRGTDADGQVRDVVVDQTEIANILRTFDFGSTYSNPTDLVAAAAAFRKGDSRPLLDLAAKNPLWGLGGGDPDVFSVGDNMAAQCNDADFVWGRTDPIDLREEKFEAALGALPADTFEPFSVDGWIGYGWPDICIGWPAPNRFEPAVPPAAVFPDVPTLILAGDIDAIVPIEQVQSLKLEFPHATFVVVAGGGHPVTGPAWGHCAAELVAQLFDTLMVSDTSCAGAPA